MGVQGGTCLKKCFVETYRFSEDLDFTVLDNGPLEPRDLQPVLTETLDAVEQQTGISLMGREPFLKLRPDGRSAEGRIYYRGPRGAPGEARVKLDEPYALRRSKAGNLLVYAIKVGSGELRAYRVDRIEGVRVTDQAFAPRYANELSVALPVRTGRR